MTSEALGRIISRTASEFHPSIKYHTLKSTCSDNQPDYSPLLEFPSTSSRPSKKPLNQFTVSELFRLLISGLTCIDVASKAALKGVEGAEALRDGAAAATAGLSSKSEGTADKLKGEAKQLKGEAESKAEEVKRSVN